ncbi:MAG: hypothetical protein ACREMX_16365 [Gemmatimonadales bacterium]
MRKNRIALISPGGVLGQIIRTALEQEPELELIPAGSSPLAAATEQPGVDLLILVIPGRDAVSECRELLGRFPNLRVLAVLEDERGDASLYELHPREARLGALSPPELAQRIREVLQAERRPPPP